MKSADKKNKIKKLTKGVLKEKKGGAAIPSRCASSSSCRGGYCNYNCGGKVSRVSYTGGTKTSGGGRSGGSGGGSGANRVKAGKGQSI